MTRPPEQDLQRLLAEATFVRRLARQLVAGEADEIVQQTWLLALQHGGGNVREPQHWLARIARNVAANLRRDDCHRAVRERAAAAHERVLSPADLAEHEERRRTLLAAVDALPSQLRTVVLLRWFDGLPPRRIARELGVKAATVSTQLHRALELLRQRLDADHGRDRRAWLLPLVPFAARPGIPAVASSSPVALLGLLAMKQKLVAAAALVLLASLAALWSLSDGNATATARDAGPHAVAHATGIEPPRSRGAAAQVAHNDRTAAEISTPAAGTVLVHLTFAGDHSPAVGHPATLTRVGDVARFDGRQQTADATGTVRFEHVVPGQYAVARQHIEVTASTTVEVHLELPQGLDLAGIVRDSALQPIAGAAIEVGGILTDSAYPAALATSGPDGRFAVRGAPIQCAVGARATGHTASPVRFVFGKEGNSAEVELIVGDGGGSIEGTVADATGRPVANATIVVGDGSLVDLQRSDHIPPFAALARSDADGHFAATGLPAGEQPIRVRARDAAPWHGTCSIAVGVTASLRIALVTGASIHGVVRDANGAPVHEAKVSVGTRGRTHDFDRFTTTTGIDGEFTLIGLPAGDIALRAWHRESGIAEPSVHTTPGEVTQCEVKLSRGRECVVRCVDEHDQPVADVQLMCTAGSRGTIWTVHPESDARGEVRVLNCPVDAPINLLARRDGFAAVSRRDVDTAAGEVVLHLSRTEARARIVGVVVGPDGAPVPNALVSAGRKGSLGGDAIEPTGPDGRFVLDHVEAGQVQMSVVAGHDLPDYYSAFREVAADTTWDVGTITLPRGGVAVIVASGLAVTANELLVSPPDRLVAWQVGVERDRLCTKRLAPGDYVLWVGSDRAAAQSVPFTIRDGEDTRVEVTVAAGVAQPLDLVAPPLTSTAPWLSVSLIRLPQQSCVALTSVAPKSTPFTTRATLCLAPGDYEARMQDGARLLRATFSIGSEPVPSLALEFR